ncbi:hypothetical protein R3F64_19025, partial [Halomonas sp. 5021]|uniref:hypothetical protein n=1 Tax=Halomonas sp. 5021 TaxID=3082156 RepID=UPI002FC5A45B
PYLPLLWSPYSGPAQETNSTPNVEEPILLPGTASSRMLSKAVRALSVSRLDIQNELAMASSFYGLYTEKSVLFGKY